MSTYGATYDRKSAPEPGALNRASWAYDMGATIRQAGQSFHAGLRRRVYRAYSRRDDRK